jgi:hypothetical protein
VACWNAECPDCGLIPDEPEGVMGFWCDDCEEYFTQEDSDLALYGPGESGPSTESTKQIERGRPSNALF